MLYDGKIHNWGTFTNAGTDLVLGPKCSHHGAPPYIEFSSTKVNPYRYRTPGDPTCHRNLYKISHFMHRRILTCNYGLTPANRAVLVGNACKSISSSAQYVTLQKFFSHPSLVIYFSVTPPIRLKLPKYRQVGKKCQ